MRHVRGSLLPHDDPSLALICSSGEYHLWRQRLLDWTCADESLAIYHFLVTVSQWAQGNLIGVCHAIWCRVGCLKSWSTTKGVLWPGSTSSCAPAASENCSALRRKRPTPGTRPMQRPYRSRITPGFTSPLSATGVTAKTDGEKTGSIRISLSCRAERARVEASSTEPKAALRRCFAVVKN